jgi:hypothetical protein
MMKGSKLKGGKEALIEKVKVDKIGKVGKVDIVSKIQNIDEETIMLLLSL